MSMESQADNELQLLEEQLANGSITPHEYNRAVKEIEDDMREFSRQGY